MIATATATVSATSAPRSRTLDAHLRVLALRAVQRQRLSARTAATATTATVRALGRELGTRPLDAAALRRASAYFTAAARSIALREGRPEDRSYRLLLRIGALVRYLEGASYTRDDLLAEVRAAYGAEGVDLARSAGLLRESSRAA